MRIVGGRPWRLFSAPSLEKELFPSLVSLTERQEWYLLRTQLTAGEYSPALKVSTADITIKFENPVSSPGSNRAMQLCSHKKKLLSGTWQASQSSAVEWQGVGKGTVPELVVIFSLLLGIKNYRGDVLTGANHLSCKQMVECIKSHFEDKPNCTTSVMGFWGILGKYFPALIKPHVCPLRDMFDKT